MDANSFVDISTSLPYISYVDLGSWLSDIFGKALDAVSTYFTSYPSARDRSATGFYNYCLSSQSYVDVFVCDSYRYCRAAKLLMALGYGNFDAVIQYDVYSMAEIFMRDAGNWSESKFKSSDYYLNFRVYDASSILNSPNLSILPLLAYHPDSLISFPPDLTYTQLTQ